MKCPTPAARSILCLLVFLGQIQMYAMKFSLSLLIVAMVKDQRMEDGNRNLQNSDGTCNRNFESKDLFNSSSTIPSGRTDETLFEWDELTRGFIFSAMSYGYICTQVVGGRLTEIYGIKKVYGFSQLSTAVICFLSPSVAKLHLVAFIILRAIQGGVQGVTFPSLQAMVARWVPMEERSSFIARSFFGTTFGLIITYPLCGALVEAAGWESAFYVIGGMTIVWFIFWSFLAFDSPDSHPRISRSEFDLIKASLDKTVQSKTKDPVPWKSMLTSVPAMGLVLVDACNSWGIIVLATNGPTYMKFMLGVDIKTNGILSGLPMLCRYCGGVFHSWISDWILQRKLITVVTSRRIFNTISQIIPAVAMLMLVYPPKILTCDVTYATTLLCVGMFFNGSIASGHFSSFTDLTPNFAGTLMGIANTASSFVGIIVPIVVGSTTRQNMTFSAWKIVFTLAATIYALGNFVFLLTCRGHPQSWNFVDSGEKRVPQEVETKQEMSQ